MKHILLSGGVLLLGLHVSRPAEPPPTPEQFDTIPKDGRLNFEEFINYQLKARNPKIFEVDTNGDFQLSDSEKRAWATRRWWDIKDKADENGVSFKDVATTGPITSPEAWTLEPLRMRKDHASIIKDVTKADPASFGFYRNNLTSEDTWAAQAALGAVIQFPLSANSMKFGNYSAEPIRLVPSASLDRVTGKGPGNLDVADALVFRAGIAWGWQQDTTNTLWDYQLFSASFRSAGATKGGKFASGGELEWEPMRNRTGKLLSINGPLQPISARIPLYYRFTFAGKLEFGEPASSNDNDSFVKAGPRVGLTLQPIGIPQLSLFGEYTYCFELSNSSRDFRYLETGARWAFDRAEQIFLEAKYRYGQLPAKFTDIDVFQISLAVKF